MGAEGYIDGDEALEAVLPELKRRGCTLLITGTVDDAVSMAASRRMLGAPEHDRRRVVGLTRQAARKPNRWFPVGVDRTDRNAAVIELAESASSVDHVEDPAARARAVVEDVKETLDRVVRDDDLDTAQLRVGMYSLTPLVGRFGRRAVYELLEAVAEIVADHRGMGHVHLPREDSASIVEALDPLFDVRVELRQVPSADPTPEQRWHVDGRSTEWVEL